MTGEIVYVVKIRCGRSTRAVTSADAFRAALKVAAQGIVNAHYSGERPIVTVETATGVHESTGTPIV